MFVSTLWSSNTTSVSINGSSSTPGVNYTWSPGGNTPNQSSTIVNAPGTYSLIVTDPTTGCSNQSTVTVNSNTISPNASAGSNQTISCNNPSVTLNGNSTSQGVTYSWSPGGSTPTSSSTDVNSSGNYTLTVTDQINGCNSSVVVTVNIDTLSPIADAGVDQTLTCTLNSVSLNGSSNITGVAYFWQGPSSGTPAGNSPNAATTNVISTGSYTLTVTNPFNGCSSIDYVNVIPDSNLPNISAGNNQTINCLNTSVTLNGTSTTSDVSYQWNPGGSNPNANTTNVNSAGVYTLTVTNNSNGCASSAVVNVSIDTLSPVFTFSIPSPLTCIQSQTIVSSSTQVSNPQLSWTGPTIISGTNSDSIVVSSIGFYTLTLTDQNNGCSNIDSVFVSENTIIPQAFAGPDLELNCGLSTINLVGSSITSGAIFNWSGLGVVSGVGNDTVVVNSSGVYVLTVTDPFNGCTQSDTVIVAPNQNTPNINVSPDTYLTCLNNSVTLSGNSSNGNVIYNWNGPSGIISNNSSIITSQAGTYTLIITDTINQCSSSAEVLVSDSTTIPLAYAGIDIELTCSQSSVTLNGNSNLIGVNFLWNGPSGFSSTSQNIIVNNSGIYILTVTNLNTGCSSKDSINVSSNTILPNVNAGNSQTFTCINNSITLNGTSSSPNTIFNWSGPSSFSSNLSSVVANDIGTYILTVTDTLNGCNNSDTVELDSNFSIPDFIASSSSSTITCSTTNISLLSSSSTPGAIFNWNDVNGVVTNPLSISASGTYTLTVIDPVNGCSASGTIQIGIDTVYPLFNFIGDDTISCFNPNTNINIISNVSDALYSWSGPNGFSSSQSNSGLINFPGMYSITVTNPSNGCTVQDIISVVQLNNPQVSFGVNPASGIAPLPVIFSNSSDTLFTSYSWIFGDGGFSSASNPQHIYNQDGVYQVQLIGLTPNNTCNDTATITITVIPEIEINVPNIFTPNGDNVNEVFLINTVGLKELHVDIFDRWGLKVGEINGINGIWDGYENSEGTYYYILTAKGYDDLIINKNGYFMLVR